MIETSSLQFEDFYPFVDSLIVQAMVKKEDYTLNTFAGLRVKEINQKFDVSSWLHISSKNNLIADILTWGTTPDNIKEDSDWQTRPKWLVQDPSTWPVTEVALTKEERDQIKGFEKVTAVYKLVSHCVSSISGPQCQGKVTGATPAPSRARSTTTWTWIQTGRGSSYCRRSPTSSGRCGLGPTFPLY